VSLRAHRRRLFAAAVVGGGALLLLTSEGQAQTPRGESPVGNESAAPSGRAVRGVGRGGAPTIGVKIYEPVSDIERLLRDWRRLGINTAFVSTALAESGTFLPALRQAGMRPLVITPVFFNPEYLAAHPEAWAMTGRGERAKQDWVEFVCPSREDYRQRRLREAVALLEKYRPDGLSLDFIRHFVFWEMVPPDGWIDPLETTCFCPHCLERFQRETGVAIPEQALGSPTSAATWLFAHERAAWIRWRAELISSWVRDLVAEARGAMPGVVIGVHLVPWTKGEYDKGLLRVAGQDVRALGSLVDYVSPMCYAHMLRREPAWVGRVVRELAEQTRATVVPSIEVTESYRKERLDEAFFTTALRSALAPPSTGVVFWSWPPLAAEPSKQEILRSETARRAGKGVEK
jgi:hypothetical protein